MTPSAPQPNYRDHRKDQSPETVQPLNGFPLAPPAAGEEAAFLAAVETMAQQIGEAEMALSVWYVRLGAALRIVRDEHLWRAVGFRNFAAYRDDLQQRVGRGRTRIFTALKVAALASMEPERLASVPIGRLEMVAKRAPESQLSEWIDRAGEPGMTDARFESALCERGLATNGEMRYRMLTVLVTLEQDERWRGLVADPQVQAWLGVDGPAPALLLDRAMDLVWAEVTAPTMVLPPGALATAEAEHVGYVMAGEEPES